MKVSYTLVALVLLMPVCIGYAYKTKEAWRAAQVASESVVAKEETKVEVPQVKEKEKEPIKEEVLPTSYADAIKIAKEGNKNIFLYVTSPGCGACVKMKQETFKDENVKAALKDCVFYELNLQSSESIAVRDRNIRYVPAYFVVTPEGKTINAGVGFRDATNFIQWFCGEKTFYENGEPVSLVHCYSFPVIRGVFSVVRWLISPCYRYHVWCSRHCD